MNKSGESKKRKSELMSEIEGLRLIQRSHILYLSPFFITKTLPRGVSQLVLCFESEAKKVLKVIDHAQEKWILWGAFFFFSHTSCDIMLHFT